MRSMCLESVMDYKCVPSPLDICSWRIGKHWKGRIFYRKKDTWRVGRKIEMKNKVNLILLSDSVNVNVQNLNATATKI